LKDVTKIEILKFRKMKFGNINVILRK
jgi:hypothetical protein